MMALKIKSFLLSCLVASILFSLLGIAVQYFLGLSNLFALSSHIQYFSLILMGISVILMVYSLLQKFKVQPFQDNLIIWLIFYSAIPLTIIYRSYNHMVFLGLTLILFIGFLNLKLKPSYLNTGWLSILVIELVALGLWKYYTISAVAINHHSFNQHPFGVSMYLWTMICALTSIVLYNEFKQKLIKQAQ